MKFPLLYNIVAAAQQGGILKLWFLPRSSTYSTLIGSGLCHLGGGLLRPCPRLQPDSIPLSSV